MKHKEVTWILKGYAGVEVEFTDFDAALRALELERKVCPNAALFTRTTTVERLSGI
ncbi:hypothetical protein [Microbulbifer discodermiae]|uniref:hypothetical protein n=1 Tax=Microbulbifer sp. 2201CG32-9 TaxID=3232309 RepID=UPI00345C023F